MKLDLSNTFGEEKIECIKDRSLEALDKILNKSGEGSKFLGWVDIPTNYDIEEYEKIKECAKKVKESSEVFVVVGVGGSYLGSRAIDNSLKPYFSNNKEVELIYAGHQLSSTYMYELLEYLKDKDYSINVISKSGNTMEPAIAFRILKDNIEKKYGKEEARKRIFITTDESEGILKKIADTEEYETFVIPYNIGGRFSVFTAVGLFPLAVSGVNIDKLIYGARIGKDKYTTYSFEENIALKYATLRTYLHDSGRIIENLVIYEKRMKYISEWWKQLYAESEGKDGVGLFPVSSIFTTDLHSLGQIIQDGRKNIFETVISIKNPDKDILIEETKDNLDMLNYLSGKSIDYINKKAMYGTIFAHSEGSVPNIILEIDKLDEENIGELLYFFEMSVAVSGYMLNVNPFDQLGVEKYKRKVMELLKKS
ncbi:glucose-6-phosphate isomerase [Miniphocaeibacter massiliensis]|uniref:glucose-6-phosphate isomerase n=1 Tax=Miniphocaeibacter massiliensis TaxID=2041841 RepID=UPI003BF538E1